MSFVKDGISLGHVDLTVKVLLHLVGSFLVKEGW